MKKTPLYDKHIGSGGRMILFAGWEMPVQYSSIVAEHLSVRHQAGLFDVSHMGKIVVKGTQALELLQHLSCNDIGKLHDKQIQYNLILNQKGGVVDDVLIYQITSQEFFIVSNAANHERLYAYLNSFCSRLNSAQAQIRDESQKWQQLALQGPRAQAILEEVIEHTLDHIGYFRFDDLIINKKLFRISRTGYTGEDGFEIYTDAAALIRLWEGLIYKGKSEGLQPAGLGARDSLRLEALYPLYGQELNAEWTPVESNLGWVVKYQEPPYLGYERIIHHKKNGPPGRVMGFQLEGDGLARSGYAVWNEEGTKKISKVLSAAYSPVLKGGIGSLYMPKEYAQAVRVQIEIRKKLIPARLQQSPFVVHTR